MSTGLKTPAGNTDVHATRDAAGTFFPCSLPFGVRRLHTRLSTAARMYILTFVAVLVLCLHQCSRRQGVK